MLKRILVVVIMSAALIGCTGPARLEIPPSALAPAPVAGGLDQLFAEALSGLDFGGSRVQVDPEAIAEAIGEDAAREHARKGRQARADGRRLAALRSFREAVLAAPWYADGYAGLGEALSALRRHENATKAFLTALDLDPLDVATRARAAAAFENLGRLDDACDQWAELLRVDPANARAHARLAALRFLRDDIEQARFHEHAAMTAGASLPPQLLAALGGPELPTAVAHKGVSTPDSVIIGPAVRIDTGPGVSEANETTTAASDLDPEVVVAAWNDNRDDSNIRIGTAVTLDGGVTWTDFLLRAPSGHQSILEGDPMTAADHRTSNLWVGGVSYFVSQGGLFVARKQPGSASFETAVMVYPTDDFVDKGWMGTGSPPGMPDTTRLFVAYYLALQYSDDLGDTWSTPRALGYGFGHLPRVGPGSELYIAYLDVDDYNIKLQRSFDGGDSISDPILIAERVDKDVTGDSYPGTFRVWPFAYIAVNPDTGMLYCVWHDVTGVSGDERNVDLLFARSTDHGDSWTTPTVINGDSTPPGDQFFPWIEIDQWGRLHMLFLDTRNTPQSDLDSSAWIDAYYSFSDDDGDSWTEHRLTSAPFNSALSVLDFLGDYCGLTVAGDHVYPVYPATYNGSTDIYAHTIIASRASIFADDFENGDLQAWSTTVP